MVCITEAETQQGADPEGRTAAAGEKSRIGDWKIDAQTGKGRSGVRRCRPHNCYELRV